MCIRDSLLMASEIVNFSKCYERQDTEIAQKPEPAPNFEADTSVSLYIKRLYHHNIVRRFQNHIADTLGAEINVTERKIRTFRSATSIRTLGERKKINNCRERGHLHVMNVEL